ncbi:hypothetical protein V8B97DRAFT_2047885 [Scleroderma yunnanense]
MYLSYFLASFDMSQTSMPYILTSFFSRLDFLPIFTEDAQGNPKQVFAIASKEYQDSGIQATVFKALQQAIQQYHQSHGNLWQVIIDIILANHMSNRFKLVNQQASRA